MRHALLCALLLALLSGCGPGGLRAGGQYSGMPDTTMGEPQRNMATGTISTGGTMWSRQQGWLNRPTGY
ncbi:hypothetical protein [Roseicella aquatilis]|uniref:Lipoprotein n=1 Tax=Roseicella aquatilis TaxID=2527868 RepID=A0A4R4DVW7_9PROT|nr:hypothetical protein [Roseicella aquatilis]TCZ65446.1 hypothetical protein EXY23_04560 [Roseicella aquatilis]